MEAPSTQKARQLHRTLLCLVYLLPVRACLCAG